MKIITFRNGQIFKVLYTLYILILHFIHLKLFAIQLNILLDRDTFFKIDT